MNDESRRNLARKPQSATEPLRLGPQMRTPAPLSAAAEQDGIDDPAWAALPPLRLSPRQGDRGRLVALDRDTPAHMVFNMLRTRVAQAMATEGWSRIAVTSPTQGCGKSFVSANLALALARRKNSRVGLVDLDLRRPALANVFGVSQPGAISAFLDGAAPAAAHFRRYGDNLAIGFNGMRQSDAAERLQHPATATALGALQTGLGLDLLIHDTPPMLACDDLLALLPVVDCVLLVAGGGITRSPEIERCAKLLEDKKPILGVVLNQADDPDVDRYYYYY